MTPTLAILCGDALEQLATLPSESIHCCVTSPPYWGLRDYGVAGQLGLEETPNEYVTKMVEVFRQVRRVLRNDGTLWLNIASSYCSVILRSHDYIIARNICREDRIRIAQALSAVWSGHASAESAMQSLLDEGAPQTRKLCHEGMPEVRNEFHPAQEPEGQVLQQGVCEIGKPNSKTQSSGACVQDMREETGAIPVGHAKEPVGTGILRQGMLVRIQPEGQSLPVGGGGAARTDEPRWGELEEVGSKAGQASLPPLSHDKPTGSTSYQAIRDTRGRSLEAWERHNAMSRLPRQVSPSGDGARRTTLVHGEHSGCGLGDITFPKPSIPPGFERWCEPSHSIKPKDDCLIPARLALALHADGWWVRSDIAWCKKAPMPESVTDRPASAWEHIFLLTKSDRYYYDAEAVREVGSPASESRYRYPFSGAPDGLVQPNGQERLRPAGMRRGYAIGSVPHPGRETAGGQSRHGKALEEQSPRGSRNLRNFWLLSPEPCSDAHFATFPSELPRRCILAGTSARGCCPKCGAPWERIIEKGEADTEHQQACGADSTGGYNGSATKDYKAGLAQDPSAVKARILAGMVKRKTTGWQPTCDCACQDTVPATVLDPFAGSGTTGMVALQLGRSATLIELNPEYAYLCRKRCTVQVGLPGL